jgi:microcystin degradation protein MlrC
MSRMPTPARIAIGGFQHETNTFAPYTAPFEEFVKTDSWPGLAQGDAIFSVMSGMNIPAAGFIEAAKRDQHQLIPMLWCSAEPSSYVTTDAFEKVAGMLCDGLREIRDLDAVYLDLHGAMVVEDFEDGEGELLQRVRAIVGPEVPVIVSLDLHANVTESMVEHATAITVFRTYPHLDMAETGARAYDLMTVSLAGEKIIGGMRKIPFLFPLTSQCTDQEPCRSIYQDIVGAGQASPGCLVTEFAAGFPPADIYECGAAVLAYGTDPIALDLLLDECFKRVMDAESLFVDALMLPDEAVMQAQGNTSSQPVVLADVQDNSGAGGTSDTTGLLAALVRNQAQGAVMAVMHDPEVAALAHSLGEGAEFDASLGGNNGPAGVSPFKGRFVVEALADGNFRFTGDMYKDLPADLGPMALLRIVDQDSDVRVIVGSERVQCLDLAIFRHLGVEPEAQRILAVKSSVHFRADFDPIAAETLVVAAAGVSSCQLAKLTYKHLRPGVRLEPSGFTAKAKSDQM